MKNRRAEYEICQMRGHQHAEGSYTDGQGTWEICTWCGTHYRNEVETVVRLVERKVPKE